MKHPGAGFGVAPLGLKSGEDRRSPNGASVSSATDYVIQRGWEVGSEGVNARRAVADGGEKHHALAFGVRAEEANDVVVEKG